MNLLKDPWLPFKKADGSCQYLSVQAVLDPDVVDLALPREDFQGAAYQFLIGLLQTLLAPADKDEWTEQYTKPPSREILNDVLERYSPAFEVTGDGGCFMQDWEQLEQEKPTDIAALLIDSPGASTIKNNTDHFVKAGRVQQLCSDCATMALFTLQINAPAGGKGHRTGLRGGGPLTTLVMPFDTSSTFWQRLWLNVLDQDEWDYPSPAPDDATLFPWLAATRVSDKGQGTYPEQMHSLHPYWSMPRRIRLVIESAECACDMCGRHQPESVRSIRTRNYGTNYDGPWSHPLTPYRFDPKKPEQLPYSRKAQPGGIGYRHWEALVIEDRESKGTLPASVVKDYAPKRQCAGDMGVDLSPLATLWVFGYDMDNMKPRCWYGTHMPVLGLPGSQQVLALQWLRDLVGLTQVASGLLQGQVKEAWFRRPKDVKGDFSFVSAALWEKTGQQFYQLLMEIGLALSSEQPPERLPADFAAQWYRHVIGEATQQFDDLALSGPAEQLDMKRITHARNVFRRKLFGSKEAKAFRQMGLLTESTAAARATT